MSASKLKIGDKVRHYRFGLGTVVSIRPHGKHWAWDKVTIKNKQDVYEVDDCDLFKVPA